MTERSVTHASVVIERVYSASPKRVYFALSDPVAKRRWFKGPDEWDAGRRRLSSPTCPKPGGGIVTRRFPRTPNR